MVESIIMDMYQDTDDSGILYINGWGTEPEEVFSFPRFYRCRMNWDFSKADRIARQASDICEGLYTLGRRCGQTGQDIPTETCLNPLVCVYEVDSDRAV